MLQRHNTQEIYFCDMCEKRFKVIKDAFIKTYTDLFQFKICNELKNHKNEKHGKNFKPAIVIQEQEVHDVGLMNELMIL